MKIIKYLLVMVILVSTPVMAQLDITVMTYNIFGGKGADGVADDEDIPRLGRVISAQSPDLLGLQESWEDQATELGSLAGLDNVEWAAPGKVGEALLSNFPITNVKKILLPPDDSRMLIFSEVEVTSRTGVSEKIVFITTHFVFNDDAAKLASAKIVDSVFNAHYDSKQPAIFTGDLNSRIGSDPINYLDQSWEIEEYTYKIDWAMYRPADRWNVISVEEINTGEAQQASDHMPIVLKLNFLFETGIENKNGKVHNVPVKFDLVNSPEINAAMFQFTFDEYLPVSVRILNCLGRTVQTLYKNQSSAGKQSSVVWDYTNNVPAGMYQCLLQAGTYKEIKSLTVIK